MAITNNRADSNRRNVGKDIGKAAKKERKALREAWEREERKNDINRANSIIRKVGKGIGKAAKTTRKATKNMTQPLADAASYVATSIPNPTQMANEAGREVHREKKEAKKAEDKAQDIETKKQAIKEFAAKLSPFETVHFEKWSDEAFNIPVFCAGTDYDETKEFEIIAGMNRAHQTDNPNLFLRGAGKAGHAANSAAGSADGFRDMYDNTTMAKEWLIENITLQILQHGRLNFEVPIMGWSRGGVTAVMVSNQLEEVKERVLYNLQGVLSDENQKVIEENLKLESSLFLVDPVPGPSNLEDGVFKGSDLGLPSLPGLGIKTTALSNLAASETKIAAREMMANIDGNFVKDVVVIRARDEGRAMMKGQPLRCEDPNVKITEVWLPGTHSQQVEFDKRTRANDGSTNAVRNLMEAWAKNNNLPINTRALQEKTLLRPDEKPFKTELPTLTGPLNAIEYIFEHELFNTSPAINKYRRELFDNWNRDNSAAEYLLQDFFKEHNFTGLANIVGSELDIENYLKDNPDQIAAIKDELENLPSFGNFPHLNNYINNITHKVQTISNLVQPETNKSNNIPAQVKMKQSAVKNMAAKLGFDSSEWKAFINLCANLPPDTKFMKNRSLRDSLERVEKTANFDGLDNNNVMEYAVAFVLKAVSTPSDANAEFAHTEAMSQFLELLNNDGVSENIKNCIQQLLQVDKNHEITVTDISNCKEKIEQMQNVVEENGLDIMLSSQIDNRI